MRDLEIDFKWLAHIIAMLAVIITIALFLSP